MYKLVNNGNGVLINIRKQIGETGVMAIPIEPGNRDYDEYLKWVAEGNTPEPADE
jgi:hypothetical protein